MALPQPKVLNLTSEMVFEFGSTRLVYGQSNVKSHAQCAIVYKWQRDRCGGDRGSVTHI